MPDRLTAVALNVDAASLLGLREALPDWAVEVTDGATTPARTHDGNPGAADLLVVGACAPVAETLGLCRVLRGRPGRAQTPLLVLVPPAQDALVRAALHAGADSCLFLPVHARELVSMVTRVRQDNRPERHTLNLDQALQEDRWRDDGGQG